MKRFIPILSYILILMIITGIIFYIFNLEQKITALESYISSMDYSLKLEKVSSIKNPTEVDANKLNGKGGYYYTNASNLNSGVLKPELLYTKFLDERYSKVITGSVIFFDGTTCPKGYTEIAEDRGRYIVGLNQNGTVR